MKEAQDRNDGHPGGQRPFPQSVGVGATHCGSGCMMGDLCAEWLVFWLGLSLLGYSIFAAWCVDHAFAFIFGIAFQYVSIAPMRGLSPRKGIAEAIKADTLSLTAWQVGMYGFMALAHFYFYEHLLEHKLEVNSSEFWFMMQIGMLSGFATAYPINGWLLRRGVKEKM